MAKQSRHERAIQLQIAEVDVKLEDLNKQYDILGDEISSLSDRRRLLGELMEQAEKLEAEIPAA